MKIKNLTLLGFLIALGVTSRPAISESASPALEVEIAVGSMKEMLHGLKNIMENKSNAMKKLAVQTMRNQHRLEERIRAEGDSGIVQVRGLVEGSDNYYSYTATGHGFAALHDHTYNRRVLGMAEVEAVLNGVEFRTAHSDYRLVRPSTTSRDWLAVEPITGPAVPDSVLAKSTVAEQMEEMAEYFRAFKHQDKTIRDYGPYFKPVLCYLEAAWMTSGNSSDDYDDWLEGKKSQLGGNSWDELYDRYHTESVMGTKDFLEQNAHLPTTIISVDEGTGEPVYAQWNYRQLCVPVEDEIPTSSFKQVDDVAYRMARGLTKNDTLNTRGAHFTLDSETTPGYRINRLLHRLVSRVPGMDNIPDLLTQAVLGNKPEKDVSTGEQLNLGYYNHWYDIGYHNGYRSIPRGFSDANLFIAMTTQPRVAAVPVTYCKARYDCEQQLLRVSYMIPLEIVFLTPLQSWNPYNLSDFGTDDRATWKGNKNGYTQASAYNGVSDLFFFQTPLEFFTDWRVDADPMDRNKPSVWVKDSQDVPQQVAPSGIRMIMPSITGNVGEVRTRYPIAPVHGRGSSVWKELSALKESLHL